LEFSEENQPKNTHFKPPVLHGFQSAADTPLTTNTPVAYWAMQVADGELLVRFETDSTNLLFMGQRVEQAPDGGFCVISDGKVEEP